MIRITFFMKSSLSAWHLRRGFPFLEWLSQNQNPVGPQPDTRWSKLKIKEPKYAPRFFQHILEDLEKQRSFPKWQIKFQRPMEKSHWSRGTLTKTNIAPGNGWLEYVGILVSFWDGLFSGAIFVSGSVLPIHYSFFTVCPETKKTRPIQTKDSGKNLPENPVLLRFICPKRSIKSAFVASCSSKLILLLLSFSSMFLPFSSSSLSLSALVFPLFPFFFGKGR